MAFYARSGSGGPYTNLNLLFKARTSPPAADTKYVLGGNDLSSLFEPSAAPADRVGFPTHYLANGVDLTDLYMDINYVNMIQYLLSVYSGTGTGMYNSGSYAAITASAPPTHYSFDQWFGDTVVSPTSAQTTILMSSAKVVSASYIPNEWTLTVTSGSGDGTFSYFATMSITAEGHQHISSSTTGAIL
jgi:hypothetical protein